MKKMKKKQTNRKNVNSDQRTGRSLKDSR